LNLLATFENVFRDVGIWNHVYLSKDKGLMKEQLEERIKLVEEEYRLAKIRFDVGQVWELDLIRPQEILADLEFLYSSLGFEIPKPKEE